MTSPKPDLSRFDAFVSAVATRLALDLGQDPAAALEVDRTTFTVRGLIDSSGGTPTWLNWPIDWNRMVKDSPEALAYEFVEDLKRARAQGQVLAALSDSRYEWRTIEGVAKEVNKTPLEVEAIIASLADEVVQSRVPDKSGRRLFATRQHYRSTHNAVIRLGDIFRVS